MTLPRVVTDEMLDQLPAQEPAARRARRDLARVHRVMGTRAIISLGWQALLPAQAAGAPLRILELGAGDGTLLLGAARSLAARWPRVQLSLMDRQDIVAPATLAGFADVGWSAQVHVADVLAWAARPHDATRGLPVQRWDLISTTLFLHQFERQELRLLLAAVASRSDRFFACEPSRSWLALAGSHLVGALGANALMRKDAVLSARAGFRAQELSAQWPRAGRRWSLQESAAGLFSHRFSACSRGADT
jgi:hypothetical protein